MLSIDELYAEVHDATERIWFVQSTEILERTDFTISVRLYIQSDLFVQVFLGEVTGSLYFGLVEKGLRIFGVDFHAGARHSHPYDAPHRHVPLLEGLEPKPLLRFLAKVEELLLQHELL
jgi:hypothetical protein